MQEMLRRTVTVGKNYALHIVTTYLIALVCMLAILVLAAGMNWNDAFVIISLVVVTWCAAGISVCFYALSQIDGAVQQIKEDMRESVNRVRSQVMNRHDLS